jgi:AraC-like DNA-binding protein
MLPSILYISKRIYNQELSKELDLIEKEEINYNFHFDISEIIREKQYYLTEDLNLDVLASHIGTNRTYLSRFINNELKTNFYDYINNFRIEHAENLLKDPNCKLNLESIAYESGFRSYSTFNRFFKKKYNTTPGDFRTKHLNGNFL